MILHFIRSVVGTPCDDGRRRSTTVNGGRRAGTSYLTTWPHFPALLPAIFPPAAARFLGATTHRSPLQCRSAAKVPIETRGPPKTRIAYIIIPLHHHSQILNPSPPPESSRILQNPPESSRILQNPPESSKISQDSFQLFYNSPDLE